MRLRKYLRTKFEGKIPRLSFFPKMKLKVKENLNYIPKER